MPRANAPSATQCRRKCHKASQYPLQAGARAQGDAQFTYEAKFYE